jgi:hypothetical protein
LQHHLERHADVAVVVDDEHDRARCVDHAANRTSGARRVEALLARADTASRASAGAGASARQNSANSKSCRASPRNGVGRAAGSAAFNTQTARGGDRRRTWRRDACGRRGRPP